MVKKNRLNCVKIEENRSKSKIFPKIFSAYIAKQFSIFETV